MPIRTCIGCRKRAAKNCLVRIVVSGGAAVRDVKGCLPGRGAWVHSGCVTQALHRRAFARALKFTGPIDPERLLDRPGPPADSGKG
ncbi:MAG: YlxR family protein [Candidatus Nanopelagicales bacterium]